MAFQKGPTNTTSRIDGSSFADDMGGAMMTAIGKF